MVLEKILKVLFFFVFAVSAQAQQSVPVSTVLTQSPIRVDKKLSIELFNYEESIYSKSQKTQLGDQIELNTRFRYQFTDDAWASLGFSTDPDVDRFDNKTSDFELRTGYRYESFVLQLDLSLNTSDSDGGITFGPDVDSRNTFLTYNFSDRFQATFFPFNFDSSTGVYFQTDNVAEVHFVTGAPSVLNTAKDDGTALARKTIPGFEFRYGLDKDGRGLSWYVGAGAATYLYSSDPNFNIRTIASSLKWERKEDIGYKLGGVFWGDSLFASFQYVGHTKDKEVGALLKSSTSLYTLMHVGSLVAEFEGGLSKAGAQPYRVDRSTDWFDLSRSNSQGPTLVNPMQRVYSDRGNKLQNWIGETGYVLSGKVGRSFYARGKDKVTPYVSYAYLSEDYVYGGDLSAHRLRNQTETLGAGGLHRVGLGFYYYTGNFIIHPRVKYLKAKNHVFASNSDVRNDTIAAQFNSDDLQFFLNVAYYFDKRTGPRTFRLR